MIELIDKQAKKRESTKRWRKNNPEKHALNKKRYQQNHAEHINAYNQAYRLRHQKTQALKEKTNKDQ